MDAVIHNAGVYSGRAVNVAAPYTQTATMLRPDRLIYLSSGMSLGGHPRLDGVDWARPQGWRLLGTASSTWGRPPPRWPGCVRTAKAMVMY